MTIGILAARYAKAFYGYAQDNAEEKIAYQAMKNIAYQLMHLDKLKPYLTNPVVDTSLKISMLQTATCNNTSKCVTQFLHFLFKKEKQEFLLYIAMAYQDVYRKAKNTILAELETAVELDQPTIERITKLLLDSYKNEFEIELETRINFNLIGGFKLTVEGRQLNASVQGQLDHLKKALLKSN